MPAAPPSAAVGIYARKSRFSTRSESIDNQVTMCRNYCDRLYPDCPVIIYDGDEGFSGGNTSRPSFRRMMDDVKQGKVRHIVCYRLDRVARNIRDLCDIIDDLQRIGCTLQSVTEAFDLSGVSGKYFAIMCSVFAEFERALFGERLLDNLYEEARQGRWLGGIPPTGYTTGTADVATRNGKVKQKTQLVPIESELALVRTLFSHFVELGSLSALLKWTLQNGIRTKNGAEYSRSTLRRILENPVYCTADSSAWDFFYANDFSLSATREDFDGVRGLMPYNRTKQTGAAKSSNPTSDWIISVGTHPGAIPGAQFVQAQHILSQNKDLSARFRGRRTEVALLSGVIRCASCGAAMRPRLYGDPLPDGSRRFYYGCTRKMDSQGHSCQMKNAPGIDCDALVIQQLNRLSADFDALALSGASIASDSAATNADALRAIDREIATAQRQLDSLITTLSDGAPASARQRIYQRMEELDALIQQKNADAADIRARQSVQQDHQALRQQAAQLLASFGASFHTLTHDQKRRLIRSVVDSAIWDGENLTINVLGAKTLPG